MRITINIVRRDAAALTAVTRQLNQIQTAASKTGKEITNWGTRFDSVTKFGKNLQWTGRQLEYRFTLPLVAAGAAATKFALDNERALTQVRKVYGEVGGNAATLNAEVDALAKAFELLSGMFGVNQAEVIGVAADWAAAGAAGAGLAKRTRATLEAMILGEMEATEATEALITVTQAYGLSSDDLTKALAIFNVVENETAVRMDDLIKITQVVGGAAREAGVDIRHLAAMAASLIPAAGSASEAGNALKTTIASIMAPTGQAADAFAALGVQIDSAGWANSNFTQRLELLSQGYADLSQNQKLVWARNVVNIRQISRLAILLNDVNDPLGRYNKALATSADEAQNAAQYNKELGTVLASQPRAFQAMIVQIQNALATIILPLLPVILSVLNEIRKLIVGFTNLDPKIQKTVLTVLALLAALGPVVAYMGSFGILLGTLGKWIFDFGKALIWLATNPVGWWILAIIAAGVVIWIFHDEIWAALKSIAKGFWDFVTVVGNALVALWKVVFNVAKKIYEALQWINPFARHSPSLVDNVRAGVATILDEYDKLRGVGSTLNAVQNDIEAFNAATQDIQIKGSAASRAKDREDLAAMGATPEALAIFDRLTGRMAELQAMLPTIQAEINAQAAVVARWAAELKRADIALAAAEAALDNLKDAAASARDELDAAKAVLDDLYNYNISGERAASDAIFENEMAVKALRLELLKLEESGQSVEDVTDQLGKLSGEIEKMQAMEKDLRLAGAGSEITGPIQAQINALDAQRRALQSGTGGGRSEEIKKQIDQLERQGEILELENSIKFDPLRRQLELLKNGIKEMDFDKLVASIKAQKLEVGRLTDNYEKATDALEAQQKVVDELAKSRKAIAAVYDQELDKLDALKDAYNAVADAIQDVETAVGSLKASSGGGDTGLGAEGDFPVPGGSGSIGREGGLDDINALIDQWTKDMQDQFDQFDLFGTLKKKMEEFKTWWAGFRTWWEEAWDKLAETAQGKWGKVALVLAAGPIMGPVLLVLGVLYHFRDEIGNIFDWVFNKVSQVWGFLQANTEGFKDSFLKGIQPILDELARWGPVFEKVREIVQVTWDFIAHYTGMVWNGITTYIIPVIEKIAGAFVLQFEKMATTVAQAWDLITKITGPAWEAIGQMVALWIGFVRKEIMFVLNLLTGDWGKAWDQIKGLFGGFVSDIRIAIDTLVGYFEKLPGRLKAAAGDMFGFLVDQFKAALNGIIGTWNNFHIPSVTIGGYDPLGPFGPSIPEVTIGGWNFPNIPYLSKGGIALPTPGGTLAVLGERGRAEAIVPLDVGRGMGGGTTVIINGDLSFPNVQGAGDAEGFVRNLKVLAS